MFIKRSQYGFEQAARAWNIKLFFFGIYTKKVSGESLILACYVDDLVMDVICTLHITSMDLVLFYQKKKSRISVISELSQHFSLIGIRKKKSRRIKLLLRLEY